MHKAACSWPINDRLSIQHVITITRYHVNCPPPNASSKQQGYYLTWSSSCLMPIMYCFTAIRGIKDWVNRRWRGSVETLILIGPTNVWNNCRLSKKSPSIVYLLWFIKAWQLYWRIAWITQSLIFNISKTRYLIINSFFIQEIHFLHNW